MYICIRIKNQLIHSIMKAIAKFRVKRGHSFDVAEFGKYGVEYVDWGNPKVEQYLVHGEDDNIQAFLKANGADIAVFYGKKGMRPKAERIEGSIKVTKERGLAAHWYETPDGDCWYIGDGSYLYCECVDPSVPCVIKSSDNYPTTQELEVCGLLTKKSAWDEYEISYKEGTEDRYDEKAVQKELADNGFNVSLEAIRHNYDAWCDGFKSGYRDTECHVFTPAGHINPLRFTVSKLHPFAESWQKTYIA